MLLDPDVQSMVAGRVQRVVSSPVCADAAGSTLANYTVVDVDNNNKLYCYDAGVTSSLFFRP
jgi:hypothetical protein